MAIGGKEQKIRDAISELVKVKKCGPILIRLSWHDAGVFSAGTLKGGCPNAVMRFKDGGEGKFGANAGLPTVALDLLKPIAEKFADNISQADLWALAANIAIKEMGGPEVPTRFGRVDAKSSEEAVESQVGRLPDGDKGVKHLRDIFKPKGFNDQEIVALSGAHTLGRCHTERSGFGPQTWTETPLKFNNAYFTDLLEKDWGCPVMNAKKQPQHVHEASKCMMLISDVALLLDPEFKKWVDVYAKDEKAFFADFVKAWTKIQENGCVKLRNTL